jgi:hypothetical protein
MPATPPRSRPVAAASNVPETSAGVSNVQATIAATTSSGAGRVASRATPAGSCGRKATAAPKAAAMTSARSSRWRRAARRAMGRCTAQDTSGEGAAPRSLAALQGRARPRRVAVTSRVALGAGGDVARSSPMPRARPGSRLGEEYAEQRSDHDVARIVNACVHARVGHEGGKRAQRQGDLRLGAGGSGGERKGGRRMPGRKRARARHSHLPGGRRFSIWTSSLSEWLQSRVHDRRRDGDRHEAVDGGTPAIVATGDANQDGGADPDPGVVRRVGQPTHRAVERWDIDARDRRVHRDVDAVSLAEPAAHVHRRIIV